MMMTATEIREQIVSVAKIDPSFGRIENGCLTTTQAASKLIDRTHADSNCHAARRLIDQLEAAEHGGNADEDWLAGRTLGWLYAVEDMLFELDAQAA